MKIGLRFAAVALLSLAGVLGVSEAAHAQTVIWSATLTAESDGDASEGYDDTEDYGSLSSRTFTYKGKSFAVNSIHSSFGLTRMNFASGGGHVERDLFGKSANPRPVTLNIGDGSWVSGGSGVNFGGGLVLIFSAVIEAGNTYAVSITTTEPGAPQSLTATSTGSTEVKLNWSAPSSIGGSTITGYKYRYKKSSANAFGDWTAIDNSASLTEHTVGGLEAGTGYTFQMLAANSSGDGLYSGEATATTDRGTPTVTLVLDRDRISEVSGQGTVTATLDQPSTAETTVTVSASAVSPAMASHFTLSTNKVLTIAAEETSSTGTVTIEAVNNAIDDDDRQVTVSATATNTAGIKQPSSRTLTIFDDESASTKVTLSVSPASVQEDATGVAQTVTVTAELDGDPLLRATDVTVSVSDGTAVAGTHYSTVEDITVTIPASQTSGSETFTLAPIDDNLDKPDVRVTVTGTTTSGLSIEPESGLSVKILDDDDPPAVTLVLDPDSIDEDGGKSTVTATLNRPSIADIEVTVSASPVSPAVASDFTLSDDTVLTIEAGDTASSGTVTITANNNDVGGGDQRVTVSGDAASDADLTPPQDVTLTITEDDAVATTVTLTVDRSTVAEDAAGSDRTVTVTAELDGVRAEATPVAVSVTGGTAVAGTDYATVAGFTVTIAARETSSSATFTLAPVDDETDEPNETVVLTGTTTESGLTVAPADGVTVTITDNDPRPRATLVLTPARISEDGGESTVTATLDRPSGVVTTINVSEIYISPTSSSDARRTGSTLTIAAGATESTGTVKYVAVNNNVFTQNKAVRISGVAANFVGVMQPSANLLTIVEDDTASTKVTLSASPVTVSEGGGDQTVTLTATVDEAARPSGTPVRVSVSGGTAVAGTDFSAVDDFTFRILPRRTSGTGTFTLSPINDEVDGADKTVTVTATTPDSVGLPVEPDSGLTITIEDDEGDPRLSLNLDAIATDNTVNIAEKTAGFSISGDTGSEAGVTVSVAVGATTLTATSADDSGTAEWSVTVPADATYITGTSVDVTVSASKTGFTPPTDVERTLTVDLAAPSVTYTAPASLQVGAAVDVQPSTSDTDLASYSASGLPSGLSINGTTGAISGTPDTVEANTAEATVTVTDTAGNPAEVSITFPAVAKGDQTLTGFEYSANSITFGDSAPTVTAPPSAVGTLSYTATPAAVCTVDETSGALTIVGAGACEVTVTAASTDEYNEAAATVTVTVNAAGTLSLSLDAIATDNTVNIAEKTAGFSISGDTGSEAGVTVSVAVGATTLTATSADDSGTAEWSVTVPADATYITGTSVDVTVSASKTGFTPPTDVERTLTVDLAAPSVTYTAPASLQVGAAVDVQPSTSDTDLASYSASGLPSGLSINGTTGAISGTPDTVEANTAEATVTVTDTAGNPAEVSITFPAVAKGDQTLTGFEYSANSITFGDSAPTVTAPPAAVGTLSYTATPAAVCTVDETSGALTIVGAGACEVTVTAASTDEYNEAAATVTVTVNAAGTLSLSLDAIATDNTVNIAEKTAGFSISGDTGSEAGVTVSVAVGATTLTATSADDSGTAEWSVTVPADATYITGTSVDVTVSASKTGFTPPTDVERTLTIDLTAPTAPSYTAPDSLKLGSAITAMSPTGGSGIDVYGAVGLPSGLSINAGTGVISGTPDTIHADTAEATVRVSDNAGNSVGLTLTFPMVAKGDQTLTGFEYSANSITFGDSAPTVTAPPSAVGTLSYTATPAAVCTVDETSGALTIVGAGACEVTVTAASTDEYNEAAATVTVTVNAAGTLSLNLDAIATDNTVNIAEKTAGFSISGDTGSEAGVTVSVAVGATTLTATSADDSGTAEWSVTVPADATYITGTSVDVTVSASKTGFTPPTDVERTLTVDLAAPSVTYTAPASLQVGAAVDVQPSTSDTDLASYSASGLPSGLSINGTTGAISGTPDTVEANTAEATVTVTDTAGNPAEVSITFPAVAKGDQTLTGFEYSANSITFGDSAPTVTAPPSAVGTLSYTATPAAVCTVDETSGALTIVGAGACEVTVTAASTDEYNEAAATVTVTVNAAGTLSLNLDAIATDNTVNIAEKTAGFSISGDTGSEAGVTVSVAVGATTLTATSADDSGTAEWSVTVPADATYITGTSVDVTVSASKTGFTPPTDVERTLTVDLAAPSVTYTAPASLQVGAAVDVQPSTSDTDLASYSASGLPSGLSINGTTGAISGTPDTVEANTAEATVTVTDTAGNPAEVSITFPAVAKGDQTLTGFEYSANSITFGDSAPTVTAPPAAVGTLSYTATPAAVCTVDETSGALTIVGAGACEVTVTAASTDEYNEAAATVTVTVNAAGTLSLSLDAIATDNTVNIAEKTAGFSISGDTGSEAGVTVSVAVGATTLTATSADDSGTAEWSVTVPADATYITGTSVDVTVSASKTGFTPPTDVERTLTIDLTAPTAPSYTAPDSLKLGSAITAMSPTGGSGIDVYGAVGLPSGLSINAGTGVISGTPDTIHADTAEVTVRVSDNAGNSVGLTLTFPMVAKGDQTLTGFEYSANSITFGDSAPTVTAPPSAVGTLSYTATPAAVCTVDETSGALTIVGAGACEVTVTAASTDEYNEAAATVTVTVNAAGTLSLSLDAIATDNTVNIAEKTAGFSISGDTGSEAGVTVSVAVGATTLTATSADDSGTAEWSVTVPADATYITGTSVDVTVSASKTGFTPPTDVERTLTVDLAAPSVTYTAPASLQVGAAVDVQPSTSDTDLASYSASGLPSGLSINGTTGAISGTPDTVEANTAEATVTVTDTAGNPAEVSITFPAVAKGDQTLTGFEYSANSITFGDSAPTVTAPPSAVGTLSYTATPAAVCTVDETSGALTIVGAGACEVTVTAASTDEYNEAAATVTVTVNAAGTLSLSLDAIATDNTVNIAEKTAGFSISGDTGSEAGVTVSVAVGATTLTATSADDSGTAEWSVTVPADATYITGTSVDVTVSASKTGFTPPTDVERTLTVDLAAPSVTYTAPASLQVGAAVDVQPSTSDTDLASYSASGLPSGLSINGTTGAISGTPDTVEANTAEATVTVTDTAGNPAEVSITFPAVAKGDQTLTGFEYSANSITFGDSAPTVTAPPSAVGTLSYTATPAAVCTVDETSGALTIVGAGACEVTVTAASTDEYNEAAATVTVTVNAAGTLSLSLDAIATDNTVNIAEKTAGFSISGDTGSEAGVTVSVAVGATTLTATSADDSGTAEWSVTVPADATYITGTSVDVTVSASKTGFTPPTDVERTLTVDLAAPSVTYTAPASLQVGAAVDVQPSTSDTDLASYSASGLPSGLSINGTTGAISGTPDTVEANTAEATVTVTDTAGNPAEVSITFPAVAKGDQTLTGFEYSANSITFGDSAPTVTAPPSAVGTLSYTATPAAVCTVDETSGALTIVGAGACEVTVTAASTDEYNEAAATVTVTVNNEAATGAPPTPPPPEALKARRGDGEVHLEWVPGAAYPTDPDLAYQLRYGTEGGEYSQWQDIPGKKNARSYTVTGLENGTRYAFELRLHRESGYGTAAKIRQTPEAPRWSVSTNRRSVHEGEDVTLGIATRNAVGFYSEPEPLTLAVIGQIEFGSTTIEGADPEDYEMRVDGNKVQGYTKDITFFSYDGDSKNDPFPAQHFDLEVPVGSTSLDVTVKVLADGEEEEQEQEHMTFLVFRGEEWVNAGTWGGTGVNIERSDAGVVKQLAVADAEATEGEDPSLDFVVTLAPAAEWTVTVDYATDDGTARVGEDYTLTNGTLTFAPGETEKTVSVPVIDDTVEDTPETLTLQLSNARPEYDEESRAWGSEEAGVLIVDDEATGTIRNTEDEAVLPALSVSDARAVEGDAVAFTVSLSAANAQQVTVGYATSGGTATSGTDFTAESGTLTFAANETSKTLSVATTEDSVDEDDETFTLTLTSPTNATLDDATATGTIRDNDTTATPLTASFENLPANHDGSSEFTFQVEFSEDVGISYVTLRDESFTETNGEVTGARRVDGRHDLWEITVEPDSREAVTITLNGDRDCGTTGAVCTRGDDPRPLSNSPSATVAGPDEEPAATNTAPTGLPTITGTPQVGGTLTASADGIEDADGLTGATFSWQWLSNDGNTDREIEGATGKTYTLAEADKGKTLKVRVTFTDDGGTQESLVSAATDAVAVPLTVRFENVPAEHDGTKFTFDLHFSENVKTGYVKVRDRAFTLDEADIIKAKRKNPKAANKNQSWTITVKPEGNERIRITLPAAVSCSDNKSICTFDERKLSHSTSASVQGPVGISVADARVEEGADATLDFVVTLSRAASGAVTVDYATSDGTAQAGADYTAASGTLSFQAGESSKTIHIAVLDDAVDDGGETLTLTLSNPSKGWLTDATATGTIENSDPMPKAWLARFGRTVATHVTDAVGERVQRPGGRSYLTVGGYKLPVETLFGGPAKAANSETDRFSLRQWLGMAKPSAGTETASQGPAEPDGIGIKVSSGTFPGSARVEVGHAGINVPLPGGGGPGANLPGAGGVGTGPWADPWEVDQRLGRSRRVNLRDLLVGSSFRLTLGADDNTWSHRELALHPWERASLTLGADDNTWSHRLRLTAWGRVAGTRFDGQDGTLSLNGNVVTGTLGVDGQWNQWLAGVAVSHSQGDGSFTMPGTADRGRGDLENTMTSIHPYLRYAVNERLDVWGVLGYGWGELTLDQGIGTTMETDTALVMGAFGGRGILLTAAESGDFQLATRSDAMLTRMTSDAVRSAEGNLESADADAHRLRLALEGSRKFTWAEGRHLTPSVDLSLRHDWGDAETGFGLELGGRVQYVDPAIGLTVEAAARSLLAHEDDAYEEWGAWGTVRVDPGATRQGLVLSISPAWGATQSRANGMWSRQTMEGLVLQGRSGQAGGRLNAEVGYGFAPYETVLVRPYAGTALSEREARTYRVGTQVGLNVRTFERLTLTLEGLERQSVGQQPGNRSLQFRVTWGF